MISSKKLKLKAYGGTMTAIVIMSLVLINLLAAILLERYPIRFDLTKNKIFEVSGESKEYLKALGSDVTITVLAEEEAFAEGGTYYGIAGGDAYYKQALEVIKEYARLTPRITVRFVDIIKEPAFVSKYPQLDLRQYDVVVEGIRGARKLSVTDLFDIDTSMMYYGGLAKTTSSKAEQALTSAVMSASSTEEILVTVLEGHGEADIAGFETLLTPNNYNIVKQSILTGNLNKDSEFLIIAAPSKDFSREELKKLDAWLENDGKLGHHIIYLSGQEEPLLPLFDAFLKEWGIAKGAGIVYETSYSKLLSMTNPFYSIVDYAEEQLAEKFIASKTPFASPYTKELSKEFDTRGDVTTTVLLTFPDTARMYETDAPEGYEPSDNDRKGPFPAAIMGKKARYVDNEPAQSSVVAFGGVLSVDEYLLTMQTLGNGEYMVNLFGELAMREDVISIAPKSIEEIPLNMNALTVLIIGGVFVIILPLAIVIAGIVVFLKRRHK